MARIIFDESTDYDLVFNMTKLMLSDINALGCTYCTTAKNSEAIEMGALQIQTAQIDKDNNRLERFEDDVKAAYGYLYPIAPRQYTL